MDDTIYDEPGDVEADKGVVALKGPDSVDVLLTPEAAEETSHRLLDGAVRAHGQQLRARPQ